MQQPPSWEALQVFLVPWLLPAGIHDSTQLLIRVGFAVVIFGLTIITVASLAWNAHQDNWERNWQVTALESGLDIQHNSMSDVCVAVRTRSETLAASMPGVLLVIGLLGTFIGLGLALTDASLAMTALADAATPPAAVNGALGDMMKGLGYKFATSTWGIIGYLVLRSASALGGYEERRFRWSVGKMKIALEGERKRRIEVDRSVQDRFAGRLGEILKIVETTSASSLAIETSSAGSERALAEFLQGVSANIKQMGDSSALMAQSAESVGKSAATLGASAASLESTVKAFDSNVGKTLESVREDLTEAITTLKSTTTDSMANIAQNLGSVTAGLAKTLDEIRAELKITLAEVKTQTSISNQSLALAISALSKSVDETLASVKVTLAQMKHSTDTANATFEASTGRILTLVGTTDNMVKSVKEDLLGALQSVASGNTETRKIFTRFERIAARNEAATLALVNALGTIPFSAERPLTHVRGRTFRLVLVPRQGGPR